MRRAIFLLLLLIHAQPAPAGTLDLFVLAGQSNMQGWQGDARGYPKDPAGIDQKISFYWVTPTFGNSGGEWRVLQAQPGRFPAGHFGPEITLARSLFKSGYHPAIFKYALGSTGLAQDLEGTRRARYV